MGESDTERQKKSKVGRRGAEGRQNAVNDATPHIQSPATIKEVGKDVGKQKARGRAASRGNRSRQQ